ncbi:MAG: DMT family transporter [candidate division Zixibacteria bacterium]|nr:DMT family transporter [candidate division Zixibacteria bacterium]
MLALLGQLLLASGTFLVAKFALLEIPVIDLATARFLLSALFLLVLTLASKNMRRIERSDYKGLFLLGLLGIPINQGLFLWGLSYTSPTHAALLYSTLPVFVLLLAHFYLKEGFRWQKVSGIAMAFAGVLFIMLEKGLKFETQYLFGDFLILLAVSAWAAYTVLGKPYLSKYGPPFLTFAAVAIGTAVFLPFGIIPTVQYGWGSVSTKALLSLAYIAFLTSGIAYILWYYALSKMEASRVAVVNNFQPVVTALLSFAFFGERFSLGFVLAGVVVLIGVLLVEVA